MQSALKKKILRVMDANFNRAREGLRVCEEVARLVLENPQLTRRCQKLRYDLTKVSLTLSAHSLLDARSAREDIGRPSLRGDVKSHRGCKDIVVANIRRVQEALRVLEEFGRLDDLGLSRVLATLRFRAYALEQDFLSKL